VSTDSTASVFAVEEEAKRETSKKTATFMKCELDGTRPSLFNAVDNLFAERINSTKENTEAVASRNCL
jgi:hypothetical protein